MEPTILRFVLKHSFREQLSLLALTVVSFPFLYMSLSLPKTIINKAIGGKEFPRDFLGSSFDQIHYLLILCGLFLLLVFINGWFKYVVNVYRGVVGERMLRRLRYDLFHLVLRFPLTQFRRTSQGELVSMIVAETEPLGGYIGDSIALPMFQGGILVTILVFMFVQDPVLGTAAVALYPIQAWVIPKLQRKLNVMRKERVRLARKVSDRIGEVVTGVRDVHAHDTSQYELAEYSERMGEMYRVRVDIYKLKFFVKLLNNFIAQITPFFFFSIGGYLVIRGNLSFGALVAVLAAYKDLSDPWKELLNFYQIQQDARVKYDLLLEQFQPAGLLDEHLLAADPAGDERLAGQLVASNLDLRDEDESEATFAGTVNFALDLPCRAAVVARGGAGADRLAQLLSGLKRPGPGRLTIDGVDLGTSPESVTGRRIAYVGPDANLFSGTVRDNLLYSLKHRPTRPADYDDEQRAAQEVRSQEAALAGNLPFDFHADWIDYDGAGLPGPEALSARAIEVLSIADMDEDTFNLGLLGTIDPESLPDVAARVLEARAELRSRLQDPDIAPLVELFDRDRYNTNMTVAENLLFGTPSDPTFDLDNLADNAYVRKVLHETGLMSDFLRMGRQVAEVMIDLFADVSPGSDLFEQYSFISSEDLPEFRTLLARTADTKPEDLATEDRRMFLSLPFKLIVARHRLGLIDEAMEARLLEARRTLASGFGLGAPPVEFFDADRFNRAVSVQDNILFGRLAYGKARASVRIGTLIREVVEKLDLRVRIMEVGLGFPVGVAGSRLTASQRQKLSIARAIIKRPDLLIVDQATAALDETSQAKLMRNLLAEFESRALIWVVHRASLGEQFDHTLVMENGRVVEQGPFSEVNQPGSVLNDIVRAA